MPIVITLVRLLRPRKRARVFVSPPLSRLAGRILVLLCLCITTVIPVRADSEIGEFEELLKQKVDSQDRSGTTITSAGRHNQKLSETAAAIYVVTPEDIRRSGATSIADALRMVPGLNVARIDSNKWGISARGFNNRYANKLLVLMDGREVYNATFGGVYWEVQDYPLSDIERIEVIRGPGASLWGANAVNGVINIITKSAHNTEGGHLTGGLGTYEKNFGGFRYGYRFNESTAGRVWVKGFNRDNFDRQDGGPSGDTWSQVQTGFRLDHETQDGENGTLIGNAYTSSINQLFTLFRDSMPYRQVNPSSIGMSGFNLTGRWKKSLSLSSEISLQGFYDHYYRHDRFPSDTGDTDISDERDTFDLEFQHRFQWGDSNNLSWGLGYRVSLDTFDGAEPYRFRSSRTSNQLFSAFVQDEWSLIDNTLTLTLGSKLQHNDFTGFEGQPNIRLLWTPSIEHTFWGAISRAVRTPSLAEADADVLINTIPPFSNGNPSPVAALVRTRGNSRFAAEEVLAYELGYRFRPSDSLFVDMALFYNDYNHLRSFDIQRPDIVLQPEVTAYLPYRNAISGYGIGGEWLLNWQPFSNWSLELSYSLLNLHLDSPKGVFTSDDGNTPQHQVSARSNFNVTPDVDFDLWLRYVDQLPLFTNRYRSEPNAPRVDYFTTAIPAYVTLDARLAWRPLKSLELSLVGQNLLDGGHVEFQQEAVPPPRSLIPRGFYLKFDWRF